MGLIVEIFHFSYWSLVSLTAYCMIHDWWALALQLILSMNKVLRTTNQIFYSGLILPFVVFRAHIPRGFELFFFLAMAGKVGNFICPSRGSQGPWGSHGHGKWQLYHRNTPHTPPPSWVVGSLSLIQPYLPFKTRKKRKLRRSCCCVCSQRPSAFDSAVRFCVFSASVLGPSQVNFH